ncbi:hypothetical protein ACSBR1_018354 [Camellia fascicularis]
MQGLWPFLTSPSFEIGSTSDSIYVSTTPQSIDKMIATEPSILPGFEWMQKINQPEYLFWFYTVAEPEN